MMCSIFCTEDYVGDIVVKSREVSQHFDYLGKVVLRCGRYNFRMNPLKCALSVSFVIFEIHIHKKGIDFIQPRPRPFKILNL